MKITIYTVITINLFNLHIDMLLFSAFYLVKKNVTNGY